ncbi:MAG: hypothetical protein Q8M92_02670, partial [Candidatus Subteraquimicrobiales bacterium]|nr:hypothetical protein [Candidatus Subteraquimicrobiales bacterium]
EIQKTHKWEDWDLVGYDYEKYDETMREYIKMENCLEEHANVDWVIESVANGEYWWVPRQEDLQQIIEDNYKLGLKGPWLLTSALKRFIDDLMNEELVKYNLNHIWLCFVMKNCYNKQWNGETWTGEAVEKREGIKWQK